MRHYKCDPRWIAIRFKGIACALQRPICRGKWAFFYPEGPSLYCEGGDCDWAASWEAGECARRGEQRFDVREAPWMKETALVASGKYEAKRIISRPTCGTAPPFFTGLVLSS